MTCPAVLDPQGLILECGAFHSLVSAPHLCIVSGVQKIFSAVAGVYTYNRLLFLILGHDITPGICGSDYTCQVGSCISLNKSRFRPPSETPTTTTY